MKIPRRSVLFIDLDHTLLRGPLSTVVAPAAIREMAAATGRPAEEIHDLLRRESRNRRADPGFPLIRALDWGDIIRTVARRLSVPLAADPDDLAGESSAPPHSVALDDAGAVLAQISSPDRFLVAATRGLRKYQLPVLAGLKLDQWFDAVLTPEDSGVLKTDRAFYGDWPDRAEISVHVGDSYRDDVAAPLGFGHRAVWRPRHPEARLAKLDAFARAAAVSPPESGPRPDAVIHHLKELPAVVERLEQMAG
ncbi:MAG: HAD family hydrolase [Desulfococcaceae bacterium]